MLFDVAAACLDAIIHKKVPQNGRPSVLESSVWVVLHCPTMLLLVAISSTAAAEPAGRAATGDLRRVKVVVEVQGELKLNRDGSRVTRKPLTVKAEMVYDERQLGDPDGPRPRAARYYHQAKADMRVGDYETTSNLGSERRLISLERDQQRSRVFSPLGPLSRDELDLLDVPASQLRLSALLPADKVSPGDTWQHESALLEALLGLEVVQQADVTSTLKTVKDGLAMVEMRGTISGAVAGVGSDIELQAKYNYLTSSGMVTWLAMSIKENRSIGHAEPGFEVVSRVRMATAEIEESEPLAEVSVTELSRGLETGGDLIRFQPAKNGFRFLHDHRWRVMVDRHDVSILRMVDRGDLIAQCNISQLPDVPAGKRLTLKSFQGEIERALDKEFGQFVEASEQVNDRGLRILRVVAAGTVSELSIQWVYYHVSDDSGKCVSFVFTLEDQLAERFGGADSLLVSSLEFTQAERPEAVEPVAADSPSDTD